MESYSEERRNSYLYKVKEPQENCSTTLEAKMAGLIKTKEELRRAKDCAMQSWLDSKPLIDELEKQQSGLANVRNQSFMYVISELKSELETTNTSTRHKREEELKARTMINEMSQTLNQTRHEMEGLKLERDEEWAARSKLKQGLRLKRQTLQTLKLTLRAIRLESEAFGASAAEALCQINRAEMDTTSVQLTQEDYNVLTKRAKEETSLADWRISVSTEQRLVAEASRESTLRRLRELYSNRRSKKRDTEEEEITGDGNIIREEAHDSSIRMRAQGNNRQSPFPKARATAELNWGNQEQQLQKSQRNSNKKLVKRKKPSMFHKIRSFLVRKFTRLLG